MSLQWRTLSLLPFLLLQVTCQVQLTVSLALCVCQLSLFLNLSTSHFWLVLPLGAKRKSVSVNSLLPSDCYSLPIVYGLPQIAYGQSYPCNSLPCILSMAQRVEVPIFKQRDIASTSDMFIYAANTKPQKRHFKDKSDKSVILLKSLG